MKIYRIIKLLFLITTIASCSNNLATNNNIKKPAVRTDHDIQVVFDKNKHKLYKVYKDALKENSQLQGKTIYQITINNQGKVVKSNVYKFSPGTKQLANGINDIIYTMDFGEINQKQNATILYPIDFLPKS